MFRNRRFPARGFSLFALLMSLSFVAPIAMAECSCMCVDGVAAPLCTGFIQTPEPGLCDNTQCDTLDPPADDPLTDPPDPIAPPAPTEPPEPDEVNTYDPPVAGAFDCRDRNVWRTDLNAYKVYKVCRKSRHNYGSDDDGHKKHKKKHKKKNKKKNKRHNKHDDDNRDGYKQKNRRKHDDDDDDDDD